MTTTTRRSIVMKTSTLAGLSAATVAMAGLVAAAQVPDQAPPGGGFGPGRVGVQVKVAGPAIGSGSGPVSLITLLTQPSVQKELKLTDAQKQKIAKIDEQLKQHADQARNAMAPKPDPGGGPALLNLEMARAAMEDMKQAMQALHSEAGAAAMQELQRKQRTRLEQIRLQADGPLAFERPEVLERLNLEETQIEMIQAILAEGRGQMEQSGGIMMRTAGAKPNPGSGPGADEGPDVGPGPGGAPRSPQDIKKKFASKEFQDQLKAQFEKRRKETQGVREQMMRAIGKVLTRGQRATYQKMVGEPFDLKPLQNAAPNFSVTTFGATEAAAGDDSNAAQPKSDRPDAAPNASKNRAARSKRSP
jgi:hypothetical protein